MRSNWSVPRRKRNSTKTTQASLTQFLTVTHCGPLCHVRYLPPYSPHRTTDKLLSRSQFEKILISKSGFPALLLDGMPKLRCLRYPNRYPRYAFGWLVALNELADRAVKETGVGRDPIDYGLQLFRDAGFE